ncbi:N,N'-diacetylchitobiose transport system permease protein [Haloechinothrix alba]|uniref:N,N'-diacetylchitobiose transport system permease protein n=1 Tax=Haloechinothrix alba TaxID=664784 RepID=A0A238VYT3_9PSEU|nr:carbohydrate ABC transporter permease [Haloechinothrix alba]SNR38629.1 N,N'-diacetylchitobiose transport system permease protein [Haloechinothrix alba]
MRAVAGRRSSRVAINAAAIAVIVFSVFPVFWMVSTALKTNEDIFTTDIVLVPTSVTWAHFREIFTEGIGNTSLWIYLRNSTVVALGAVLFGSAAALLGATAVARFRFRFRASFLIMLLIVQMVPHEALLIPLFVMARQAGLTNRLLGLVIINVAFTLPFAIWMLRTFVAAVPRELEEAAEIDGASRFRTFVSILFPLVAPGLVATSIFSFITVWNEFIFAFTLMADESGYTMPVALRWFIAREGIDWGGVMATSTVMTIPVIIFFLFVQRRMVSGLVAGAVKG